MNWDKWLTNSNREDTEYVAIIFIFYVVIMLLLYKYDVLFLAYIVAPSRKFTDNKYVLENSCMSNTLSVNDSKTKVMLMMTQNKDKP